MSEISTVIRQFLLNQKTDFLEKKIAQETRDKRTKYNQLLEKSKNTQLENEKLAQEKQKLDETVAKARIKFQPEADTKYEINGWFNKAASKAKPNVTTHPAKFTNPKINGASSFLFYGEPKNDGYLKTGNARLDVKVDVSGDAATNTLIFELYSLLETPLKNGSQLITQFESDSVEIIEFIDGLGIEYSLFKNKCIEIFYGEGIGQTTHEFIRQVYFPVLSENEGYHLLSVITPSMLMFGVKNRIDDFNQWFEGQPIRALKKDNKFHPDGFDEVFGLTEIGFSHNEFTKMGNVSYLNVRNKGIAYLLPSLPPELKRRDIRLPAHDFFRNSLRTNQFKESFQSLDKLIRCPVKNADIKEGIRNTLKFIIDQVLQRAFRIRATRPSWSQEEHYQSLPLAQRIWLDDAYLEQRENQDDWLDDVVADFARWILDAYEYLFKETFIKLSDHELREVRGMVQQAVSKDQEFFK
jgi:CRISPR-associated protein Csy1